MTIFMWIFVSWPLYSQTSFLQPEARDASRGAEGLRPGRAHRRPRFRLLRDARLARRHQQDQQGIGGGELQCCPCAGIS